MPLLANVPQYSEKAPFNRRAWEPNIIGSLQEWDHKDCEEAPLPRLPPNGENHLSLTLCCRKPIDSQVELVKAKRFVHTENGPKCLVLGVERRNQSRKGTTLTVEWENFDARNVELGVKRYMHKIFVSSWFSVYEDPKLHCKLCFAKGFPCRAEEKVWGQRRELLEQEHKQTNHGQPDANIDENQLGHDAVEVIPRIASVPEDEILSPNESVYIHYVFEFTGNRRRQDSRCDLHVASL